MYKSEQEQNKAFGNILDKAGAWELATSMVKLENKCNVWKRVLFPLPNNCCFWAGTKSPGSQFHLLSMQIVPKAKISVSKNDQWNFGYLN